MGEVRRLQSLLAERDKENQDLREEHNDLEITVERLRATIVSQEESVDTDKDKVSDYEFTIVDLRTQLEESQLAAKTKSRVCIIFLVSA